MKLHPYLTALTLLLPIAAPTQAAPLSIVAAENVYGDVARQLAGPNATVTSILSNPDQDPHLFEASPSVARALSEARIVIANGADYDPWITRLLRAAKSTTRKVIVVADLVHKKPGDNPHLWYDTATMATAARAITQALIEADPAAKPATTQRLQAFLESLAPIEAKIATIKAKFPATPVTATEPVFGYMASALGMKMRNERFQLAVMNNTEPRASDVATFETDLRKHQVRILFYNSQASNTAATRLLGIAQTSGVPVVGVTETRPGGKTYQAWMSDQLDDVAAALAKPAP